MLEVKIVGVEAKDVRGRKVIIPFGSLNQIATGEIRLGRGATRFA